jgi:hypothetical protein
MTPDCASMVTFQRASQSHYLRLLPLNYRSTPFKFECSHIKQPFLSWARMLHLLRSRRAQTTSSALDLLSAATPVM